MLQVVEIYRNIIIGGNDIKLVRIAGDVGISGNEKVDRLSKRKGLRRFTYEHDLLKEANN